jgi:hypothetical protein
VTRSNKVTVYVNDAELSRLDREADDRNMSRSGYVLSAVQRQWRDDDADEAADRLDAEEKVEQIVADARDELTSIARDVEQRNEDVADMTARAGSYSIASFELLKVAHDLAEARKAETLLTGSRRLREPLDEHPDGDRDRSLPIIVGTDLTQRAIQQASVPTAPTSDAATVDTR